MKWHFREEFHCTLSAVCCCAAINPNGRDVTVDFPQQAHWTGVIEEMELVPSIHPHVTSVHFSFSFSFSPSACLSLRQKLQSSV